MRLEDVAVGTRVMVVYDPSRVFNGRTGTVIKVSASAQRVLVQIDSGVRAWFWLQELEPTEVQT